MFGSKFKLEIIFRVQMKHLKKQEYRYFPYKPEALPVCAVHANYKYLYPDIAKHSDLPSENLKNCLLKPVN
ncbi:hypothetical protein PVAND_008589 [Polypedilum vanderplanki]|uniref:Uncharacterized protein n=1 Tax=Polypedilum vanderplanki TaxID=319348 RepID=A0A9J6CBI4_POLVA|nr:hypothetical protein PVAND_008589 [Polypedilum vanderplanki]